jgi:hypothetical protein
LDGAVTHDCPAKGLAHRQRRGEGQARPTGLGQNQQFAVKICVRGCWRRLGFLGAVAAPEAKFGTNRIPITDLIFSCLFCRDLVVKIRLEFLGSSSLRCLLLGFEFGDSIRESLMSFAPPAVELAIQEIKRALRHATDLENREPVIRNPGFGWLR